MTLLRFLSEKLGRGCRGGDTRSGISGIRLLWVRPSVFVRFLFRSVHVVTVKYILIFQDMADFYRPSYGVGPGLGAFGDGPRNGPYSSFPGGDYERSSKCLSSLLCAVNMHASFHSCKRPKYDIFSPQKYKFFSGIVFFLFPNTQLARRPVEPFR